MKSAALRIIASLLSILAYGWINGILNPISVLAKGKLAGLQFEASDTSYLIATGGMNFFHNLGIPFIILLGILIWIWHKPMKEFWKGVDDTLYAVTFALVFGAGLLASPTPSQAYYSQSDYADTYFILPNETAFWVPDVGDNKSGQAAMNTEEYYKANKVSAKRFNIPHSKLANSGTFSNFYVPDGRLIVVNLSTYANEWAADSTRGTSTKNESLPCQSKEGLDVTTEVSIATYLSEPTAAKYLQNFGVVLTGDRSDPNVLFASVLHARPLADVMDKVVRIIIHNAICKETSARNLDKVNADADAIMDAVTRTTETWLKAHGIGLSSMGWAGTFSFAPQVQEAINDVYIATATGPVMPTLQRKADIEVKRGFATGLTKGIPSLLPPAFVNWLNQIATGGGLGAGPEAAAVKK